MIWKIALSAPAQPSYKKGAIKVFYNKKYTESIGDGSNQDHRISGPQAGHWPQSMTYTRGACVDDRIERGT